VIITKSSPFTKAETEKLKEEFGGYIKTVIDINKKICSAGANMHFQSEEILLKNGSKQSNVWGGGIDLATETIDFNSFINIRPDDKNTSNEILDAKTRRKFEKISQYFFKEVL